MAGTIRKFVVRCFCAQCRGRGRAFLTPDGPVALHLIEGGRFGSTPQPGDVTRHTLRLMAWFHARQERDR